MNPIMETFFLPQRSRRIPMDDAKTKAAISGAPIMMESFSSEM